MRHPFYAPTFTDDTGLGKTLQVIAYILSVRKTQGEHSTFKPFLITTPSPSNWLKELRKWAPKLNVIDYTTTKEGRELIRDWEFWPTYFPNGNGSNLKGSAKEKVKRLVPNFDILITSHGICSQDSTYLKMIPWEVAIIFPPYWRNRRSCWMPERQ